MRGEVEAAGRTVVGGLQEGAEQFSLATARAAAAKTALHCAPEVALPANGGLAGPHTGCAYGLHDLPFPDLPDFCLPRLRSFLREARWERSFSTRWDFNALRLPSRLRPRGTI